MKDFIDQFSTPVSFFQGNFKEELTGFSEKDCIVFFSSVNRDHYDGEYYNFISKLSSIFHNYPEDCSNIFFHSCSSFSCYLSFFDNKTMEGSVKDLRIFARKLCYILSSKKVCNIHIFSSLKHEGSEYKALIEILSSISIVRVRESKKSFFSPVKCIFYRGVSEHYQNLSERDLVAWSKRAAVIKWGRYLVNMPSNLLTTEKYADILFSCNKCRDISVTVYGADDIRNLGMESIYGVGKGSNYPPFLIKMEYNPLGKNNPLCFIGKGITFDSGGISIKPSNGMDEMKSDMAGSSVVSSLINLVSLNYSDANIVALVPIAENMPGPNSLKPGDIISTFSKKTVEILNTDAEGRLILADAIGYANTLNPSCVIDVATLTGAIVVALGNEYAGLFSTSDTLSRDLINAGLETGELLWRMPMCQAYDKQLESNVADLRNIGKTHPGSATAAHFLQRFVEGKYSWAHMDIAGVSYETGAGSSFKDATGFGIQLLESFVSKKRVKK